jgi:PGF-pre-PGF domain-containing protein
MKKFTHLALLYAVIIIGLLIPPVMAVETAPGSMAPFVVYPGSQENPAIDGNMVVWEDGRNGNKDIYFSATPGSTGDRITDDPDSQERPSIWGDYIAWQDNRSGNWDIYLYQRSTGTTTQLTDNPADQWLPVIHGNYIVWYDNRQESTDIVLYDIAAGSEKDLIDCNPVLGVGEVTKFKPALSDEYVAWEESGEGVWLYNIATGEKWAGPLSPSSMDQSWPSIAGDLIAWEDYRWGTAWQSAIYLRDLNTGDERQLTTKSLEQVSPTLTGEIIAWEDKRDGLVSIYMYDLDDLDDGEEMSVPTPGGEQLYPAASGNMIVWQKGRGSYSEIYAFMYEPEGEAHEVARIEIEPSTATMEVNEEVRFNATCYDQDDNIIPDLNVAWSCNNATVGFIDPGGYFNASAAGTATITAATAGISAQATVTVNAEEPVATSIEVTPTTATLAIDGTEQFSATAFDQFGNEMTGVAVAWTCSNATVGKVSESGAFTALAEGTTGVTAAAGDVSGNATVTVTTEEPVLASIEIVPTAATLAVNDTEQFTATALDQFGSEMTEVAVAWASSNETVGTIDADGVFAALAGGTTIVTATIGDVSGTATVTVNAAEPTLTDIEVAPTDAVLAVGNTRAFTTVCSDESGNIMPGVSVAWSCSNETVGTVDTSGVFTALARGTATIIATAGSVSGSATVTVEEPVGPVLTRITVTPPTATLDTGEIQRFVVTGYDQNGNVMPAGEIEWACNDGAVGTIDGDGFFTALAVGMATVTATAGNCSAEGPVTVNECPALAKIAVLPSAATLEVGDTLEFSAIAFDRFGDIVEDVEITWECSDSCVGTIDECGVFTALEDGTATITATAEGISGTATVTVNCDEPVLSSIAITPSTITLAKGDTAAFTATAFDQDGCEMPDIVIDWTCSDFCVGTIGFCSGHFIADAQGTATISATAGGVTGTAAVTVTDLCSGVVVSPSEITLDPGDTRQFTATVYDLQDNAGSIMTWSCDDEGVGTITSDGLFTAVCGGTTTVTATVDGENETATGTAMVTVRSAAAELARIEVSPSDFCIPAGNSLALTATAFDQYGYEMPDIEVTWESSDPCVGTVDECGTFTAIEEGTVTLTASADGVSGSACVTVQPSLPVPTCIEVEPVTVTMQTGETREFTATVFDQCDNEMDWIRVAWSCSDDDVGTIDRAGLFAAFAEGSADVKACAGGVERTAAVTVTSAPGPEPTPTPTPTTPPNPGNSGGATNQGWSDGGGDTGPTFFAGICENLKGGETHRFSGITVSSVGSVAITAADNIPKLMMIVKGGALPSAAEPPGDNIYEYVEITLSWVNPHEISGATVTFTVPARWLEEHGIAPEDVRFMRHVNGGWQILETEVLGEENGKYNFRATTPGFSTFAIAAAPAGVTALAEELNVTPEITGTPEETGNVTAEPTEAVPATTPAAPLVYAPLLAPLAFLLWAKKRH